MRIVFFLVSLLRVSFVTASGAVSSSYRHRLTPEGFTKADPGGIDDVEVTADNLLSEKPCQSSSHVSRERDLIPRTLPVKLISNSDSSKVHVYITGLDSSGKIFFALEDGRLIYPDAAASKSPVKITQNISMTIRSNDEPLEVELPSFIRSGRIYFSNDDLEFFVVNRENGNSLVQPSVTNIRDPNANKSWGFVELTHINNILYANISYVDFVGMVLGMMLTARDGSTQAAAGLEADAVAKICRELVKQSRIDGYQWTSLCIADTTGKPIRVLSPGNQQDIDPAIYTSYWKTYVDKVWGKYAAEDLVINTQSKAGKIRCRVLNGKLKCDGCERAFSRPEDRDIWGCNSGCFAISSNDSALYTAIVPRLCAGFVRSTLLLDGGFMQPSLGKTSYYTVDPTNHFSKIVHSYEADGKGYAFSYDDVNPDNHEDVSGVVSSDNVRMLTVHVGGQLPSSSSL